MNKAKFGVIVGRFQVSDLHQGHKDLISFAFDNCETLIVYLGNTIVKGSERDPLDYSTRRKMLSTYLFENYDNRQFFVYSLNDCPQSDRNWVKNLDISVSNVCLHSSSVLMFGGRDSFLDTYQQNGGRFKTKRFEQEIDYSGTEERKFDSQKALDSTDFRKGCIYSAYNKYPTVYTTVDICFYDESQKKFLFGEKRNCNKMFMPGGFVDVSDPSFVDAAKRELKEETGIDVEAKHLKFVCSTKVDDYRFRNRTDMAVMTNLFLYVSPSTPKAKASDDLISLKWLSEDEIEKNVDPIHIGLIREAIKSLIG